MITRLKISFNLWLGVLVRLLAIAAAVPCWAQSVTTYHGSLDRGGNFVVPALTWTRARSLHLDPSFHPGFAGHLYTQPLYWQPPGSASGELIVATESNAVAAIDARSGRTVWTRTPGPPVALATQPCGNINPLGVTGTPVIDEPSQTLYLDAMVARPAGPRHLVFAMSLKDARFCRAGRSMSARHWRRAGKISTHPTRISAAP
jgi:hypothetical protein